MKHRLSKNLVKYKNNIYLNIKKNYIYLPTLSSYPTEHDMFQLQCGHLPWIMPKTT